MIDGLIRSLRVFTSRIASVFGRPSRERDIDEELASHIDAHIEDNIRAGMTPAEARRRAVLALGGVQQTKEQVRDRIGLPQLEALVYDLRHAIRGLARRKIVVFTAILSIAFGVGVNIAAYTVLRGLLFQGWVQGLPAPERLVTIWPGISFPNYQDLQQSDLPLEMAAM